MKRNIFILVAAFAALIMSGCNENSSKFRAACTDMRFDKEVEDLVISPESDEFSIGFHKSNEAIPEDYALFAITDVDVQITTATVDPNDPFGFPGSTSSQYERLKVNYDNSGTKGSIKLKVNPQKIKEPVQIILKALMFPYPSTTINLIPKAQ